MKNIPFLLIFCSLFCSCTHEKVRIRPEKRVMISGRITQDNLPTIPVATFGAFEGYVNSNSSHKLGFSKTSTFGDFNFISLDTQNSDLAVSINPEFEDYYNEDYATLHFVDLVDDHGTHITLGNIDLPLKKEFTISVENISGTQNELRYDITFEAQELYYLILNRTVSEEVPENYQLRNSRTISGNHSIGEEISSEEIFTVEGSEIIFSYTLGQEEIREIRIPVNSQISSYVFEY